MIKHNKKFVSAFFDFQNFDKILKNIHFSLKSFPYFGRGGYFDFSDIEENMYLFADKFNFKFGSLFCPSG